MRSIRWGLIGFACALAACASDPGSHVCSTGIVCPADTECAAVQPICLEAGNHCGNGKMDEGEECDDGNIMDGDGCSHDCKSEGCGNHVRDPGETCDDGNTFDGKCGDGKGCNSDADCTTGTCQPDGCSRDCKSFEECGNGIIDLGEVCDDGNTSDGKCSDGSHCDHDSDCVSGLCMPDGCSRDCKSKEVCGNGIVDLGEVCDDGNTRSGDACESDCKSGMGCGNGIIDPGEACDDGNATDTDDCRTNCKINVCGDGVVDATGITHHEDCDPPGVSLPTATCNIDCSTARCGDGKVNPLNTAAPATAAGEQCDDGNTVNGDGCDNNCTISGCGNGIQDPGEECDDGNTSNGDGCDNNCKLTACGNGIKTGTEECDDGNTQNGDGCSSTCVVEFCGDGVTNDVNEQCDTGGISATCNGDCTVAHCGDGKINALFTPPGAPGPEQCDDGNNNNNDGCSSKCQFEFCGDGVKNNIVEQCDTAGDSQTCNKDCTAPMCGDGKVNHSFVPPTGTLPEQCDPPNPGNGCSALCRFERCGNGVIDPGEECDGASVGGFACAADCHLQKCGNGILDPGEQCDDGNNSPNDDCISNNPAPASCKINVCGDGVVDNNREQCDHGANNGTIGDTCSATCHTVLCGDGIIEQGETCDDGAGNNGPGKRCNASCHFNVCGDGDKLIGVEQCDEGPADTATCDNDCTFPVCGDGHPNSLAGETCDHGGNNGKLGDTCDSVCKVVGCGNGAVDVGEQCDPNTGSPATDSSTCDSDCTAVFCGDGHVNTVAGEVCDDGALNGNPCTYGTQTCSRCNSTCTGQVTVTGPFCGDSVLEAAEVCDQGTLNGSTCAYNDSACLTGVNSSVCKLDCTGFVPNPNGPFCGDAIVQPQFNEQCDPGNGIPATDTATCDSDCTEPICGDGHKNAQAGEACDDHNQLACGSCSADCSTVTLAAATGTISLPAAALLSDGDTFTLNDGVHSPATTFEFNHGSASAGHVLIKFQNGDTANDVCGKTVTAIQGVGTSLNISAASCGAGAQSALTNGRATSLGNIAIIVNTTGMTAVGMAGGLGGNCPTSTGCSTGNDCASGTCTAGHCL
jgi:cysteine-rich repeat protein